MGEGWRQAIDAVGFSVLTCIGVLYECELGWGQGLNIESYIHPSL